MPRSKFTFAVHRLIAAVLADTTGRDKAAALTTPLQVLGFDEHIYRPFAAYVGLDPGHSRHLGDRKEVFEHMDFIYHKSIYAQFFPLQDPFFFGAGNAVSIAGDDLVHRLGFFRRFQLVRINDQDVCCRVHASPVLSKLFRHMVGDGDHRLFRNAHTPHFHCAGDHCGRLTTANDVSQQRRIVLNHAPGGVLLVWPKFMGPTVGYYT